MIIFLLHLPTKICMWKINSSCEKTKHLVAFFCLVIPVGIWKVDVASRFFHYFFNIVATFADYMRMFCMWNIHLQGDSIALYGNNVLFLDACKRKEQLLKTHFLQSDSTKKKKWPGGKSYRFIGIIFIYKCTISIYFSLAMKKKFSF